MNHLKISISERQLYFNANVFHFSLLSFHWKKSQQEEKREERREKNEERKGQKEKATLCATFSFWWGMVDLPHPGHKLRLHRTTQ